MATTGRLTLATGADFTGQTIHVINTLRVRDTLPIKAKFAGRAIKIAETHGHARDTLSIQTLFIWPTVNIRAALSLERNADAALTNLVFGALSVVLAECVFATTTHTVSTQTTITIDAAFCGDTGELITDRAWPTVDVDDTFADKRTEVVDALEIRRAFIIPHTLNRNRRTNAVIAQESWRAILIESTLFNWNTLVVIAAEAIFTIGVDHASDCFDAYIIKADRIRRTFEVGRALHQNTLTVQTCRLNALVRAVFVNDTTFCWLTDAAIAGVSVRAIAVVSALTSVDTNRVGADLASRTFVIAATARLTNAVGAGFARLTIRR